MYEWESSLNRDYQCNVPPESGSKYCIFHQPDEKDIKLFVEQFYTQIYERGPSSLRNPRYEFNSFARALYFSVVTFVTLGYGDVHPVPGLGAALAATEAVLGSITLVFTILVIGHKFMR